MDIFLWIMFFTIIALAFGFIGWSLLYISKKSDEEYYNKGGDNVVTNGSDKPKNPKSTNKPKDKETKNIKK